MPELLMSGILTSLGCGVFLLITMNDFRGTLLQRGPDTVRSSRLSTSFVLISHFTSLSDSGNAFMRIPTLSSKAETVFTTWHDTFQY